jgi:hypothetical protein
VNQIILKAFLKYILFEVGCTQGNIIKEYISVHCSTCFIEDAVGIQKLKHEYCEDWELLTQEESDKVIDSDEFEPHFMYIEEFV